MRNILLKLLALFPCAAMGIMEFYFDACGTKNNSQICIIAQHDNGNTINIMSDISTHGLKKRMFFWKNNHVFQNTKGNINITIKC